jgi:hypothetical protein
MTNLTYIMPCFIIADLKISVSLYVDKLGFEIRYIGPDENPYWAIVINQKMLSFSSGQDSYVYW